MQIITNNKIYKQSGAVTLLTSIILLIAITLVTFLTGKTVLMETKMSANNYRTSQAIAAADAGMDYALAYFDAGGLDHDDDDTLDHEDVDIDVDLDGIQEPFTNPPFATITYFNASTVAPLPSCVNTSAIVDNKKSALIQVIGTSDDGIASRTIYQCVGTRNLLKGGGPKQTLVSGSVVDLTGSAQIINRYNDLNIWSGSTVGISGSSMETYIRPADKEIVDFTENQLEDSTTSPSILNVQKVSSGGLGSGTDIYQNDARLSAAMTVTTSDIANGNAGDAMGSFHDLFFLDDKDGLSRIADNLSQKFPADADASDLSGLNGVVYVDGDASMNGATTTIGSELSPAIVFIDGDFDFTGGTITGLIYVTGEISMAGGATVIGSMITEGGVDMGAGTSTLVYARNSVDGPDGPPLIGATGIVNGSWRDW